MTPLYCPHCRRPVSGELEHGVCPLGSPSGWIERPVEVAPQVWVSRSPVSIYGSPAQLGNASLALHYESMRQRDPLTKEQELELAAGIRNAWRVNRTQEEDFGPALTPARLSWTIWRARVGWWLTWFCVSALIAAVGIEAWMVCMYGRLLP